MVLISAFRLLLITLLLLASAWTLGQDTQPAPVMDISNLRQDRLHDPALYWVTGEDVTLAQLPLDEFQPLTPNQLNRGITDAYHWVRVRLSNTQGEAAKHWVLSHETSYLDELRVYYADNGGPVASVTLSDRVPFAARPIPYRTLAFEHTTPAGGYTDLWLRMHFIKADTLTLNLFLSDAQQFHQDARFEYLVFGSYYGLMFALVVIALIGATILRQAVYLHYAVFLGFSMLTWAQLNGLAYEYLWPRSPYWHNEGFNIVFLLMAMTALQFSRGFLKTGQYFPRVDRFMRVCQWLMGGAILLRLSGVYVPVLYLSHASLAALLLLAVLGYMAYRRGLHYARWYSLAWLFYGLGLAVSVLSAGSNLFSWGMTPLFYAQAGGVLEAVFLLVALGEKLIGWDRDRRVALAVANQDPLTGLGNRRAFEEAFSRLQTGSVVRGKPVFLVLIDLDLFKVINDEHGHDAGDEVLKDLGHLLRRSVRPDDVCIRFGGEEFALLLQAPSTHHALEIAERIRSEFAATPTLYRDVWVRHTLSAGVAQVGASSEQTRNQTIRMADRALYDAKREGRNCVRLYGRSVGGDAVMA